MNHPEADVLGTHGENEAALRVQLDVFDGPLDLLLSLIKEQQLDVATVPLASVADVQKNFPKTVRRVMRPPRANSAALVCGTPLPRASGK